MSRIRSIHPGLWTDEAFMALSAPARLLLIGLWTEAFEEMNAIDPKQLNLEQRLRRAEVKALLVIAQELVALRETGTGSAG